VASAIDLLIVRELNGDVYFGEKGIRKLPDGRRQGWDMMSYAEDEVRRIAHAGFKAAQGRKKKLCSVDKANVLETSQLWRDVVIEVSAEYPDVELSHMYVDNAAMQLVRSPGQFDVIVTGNLFGDILSDQASMCVGSIGLLASASLGTRQTQYGTVGLYEPIHGSAPDIAGQNKANPMATILSAAMLLRHSLGLEAEAARIEAAVAKTLADGIRGGDLGAAPLPAPLVMPCWPPVMEGVAQHAASSLQLAIVMPTLNERANLRPLVARLDEALKGIVWEAIFVDDNSRDGTADEARAIALEDPRIRCIQRIGRRGLASAAIEGMCSTAAPWWR
jgi:hypothetical protein